MQTSETRSLVRSTLLEFAWSQWAQMGVSATPDRHDRWAMDPEALLLFTLPVARRDPRLFDEVLDWIRLNGRLLSVQRLTNLARADEESRRLTGAALAWSSAHNRTLRFRTDEVVDASEGDVESLFRASGGELFRGEQDPRFLARGFSRPRVDPSSKSQPPDVGAPINFAFRLRLLFGIGTRSEVIRHLLTTEHPEVSAQQVAEATAFAKRNANESLAALSEARIIEARSRANERVYRADRRRWAVLLGIGVRELPDSVDWIRLLPAARRILVWIDDDRVADESDYVRSSEARNLVDELRPDLQAAGVDVPDDRHVVGSAYWSVFEDTVHSVLRKLRAASG